MALKADKYAVVLVLKSPKPNQELSETRLEGHVMKLARMTR